MIINRIKQFISAITSHITEDDETFLANHLNNNELKLFLAMDVPTQKHCLNVAYTCQRLLVDNSVNINTVLRAALLHDCGKLATEVRTWHRITIVLVSKLLPKLQMKLINMGMRGNGGSLCYAFYIKHIHSHRGAKFANQAGIEPQVVKLIKEHHNRSLTKPPELLILQRADDLN